MSDYLPAELITGILLRLPVAALLRSRCVSRAWRGLIDSPKFIKLQIDYSATTTKNAILFVSQVQGEFVDAEFVTGLRRGRMDIGIVGTPPAEIDDADSPEACALLGTCNGLICFACDWVRILIVNHATRQSYLAPAILEKPVNALVYSSGDEKVIYGTGFGFGYDSFSDDYKVVQIVPVYKPQQNSLQAELISYGVRSNSRVAVTLPNYFLPRVETLNPKPYIGVFVGGAIHWMVGRHDDPDNGRVILGFDLGLNECREVPQPEYPNGKSFGMRIGELGTCLCIFANYNERCVDVWMMKEYGVKESWSVLFSVPHPGLCYDGSEIKPLGFSMTGQEVLLLLDRKRLVWYDLKDPQKVAAAEEITVHGLKGEYVDAVVCFGSLVPLNGRFPPPKEEVKVDKQTQQKEKKKKKRDDFLATGFKLKL